MRPVQLQIQKNVSCKRLHAPPIACKCKHRRPLVLTEGIPRQKKHDARAHTHTRTNARTHAHTHAHIRTHAHVHTQTHTPAGLDERGCPWTLACHAVPQGSNAGALGTAVGRGCWFWQRLEQRPIPCGSGFGAKKRAVEQLLSEMSWDDNDRTVMTEHDKKHAITAGSMQRRACADAAGKKVKEEGCSISGEKKERPQCNVMQYEANTFGIHYVLGWPILHIYIHNIFHIYIFPAKRQAQRTPVKQVGIAEIELGAAYNRRKSMVCTESANPKH
eukprot:scaffold29105_cov19-Tisochrysis_lutea.AAC.3